MDIDLILCCYVVSHDLSTVMYNIMYTNTYCSNSQTGMLFVNFRDKLLCINT